jgi:signal transduction histidine kinase
MRRSRVVWASLVCAAALAGLLGAWFVSGWADVRAQQREVIDEPARAARTRGAELAHDLRADLQQLIAREIARPYFHYSNLFHDPRSGDNWAVTPSPLASAPEDRLVRGYFQIDAAGRVTTPTVNDEVPELSEQTRLAVHRGFRDQVARDLAGPLREPDRTYVAVAPTPRGKRQQALPDGRMAQAQSNVHEGQVARSQVVEIDAQSYIQNAWSNEVYAQQQKAPVSPRPPVPRYPAGTIPVVISALEWRTLPVANEPTLVAVRHVDTPDGTLVQGFVIDRAAIAARIADRVAGTPELVVSEDGESSEPELAPGWHLRVHPDPTAVDEAQQEAGAIASGFVIRFVAIGAVAALAFGFVVLLVARAERLARERSQFAAAAAHELRTPLAGLQLYGDMLADGLGDPSKLRDYAKRMSEEAARLGRVVSNVLGFSQLERGNLSVEPRPGDLAATLRELADRAQPALDRAGAVLDLDVPGELRATFDRDALARIVGNLLDNAEKYSRGVDDRTIGLRASSSGEHVEIAVTDRGPGVTAAARPRLFRPFTRGVGGDGPAGLGLGLALSRSLAQAMGGELAYRPGETGTTFVLTVPN